MNAVVWIGVVLLGGLGSVLRLLLDGRISAWLGRRFPYGILVVNVSGALLLGAVNAAGWGRTATLLVGTATLGAYTTFSTWMLDSQRLAERRRPIAAAANLLVSLLLGLAAAALGRYLVR